MKQNPHIWKILIGLLIANLAVLIWLLFLPNLHSILNIPPVRIEKIVGFDKNQKQAFGKLLDKHFKEIEPIRDSVQLLMNQSYDLIKSDDFKPEELHQKILELGNKIARNEELKKLHLREVRQLCSPEQRQKFDNEVLELFKKHTQKSNPKLPRHPFSIKQ